MEDWYCETGRLVWEIGFGRMVVLEGWIVLEGWLLVVVLARATAGGRRYFLIVDLFF